MSALLKLECLIGLPSSFGLESVFEGNHVAGPGVGLLLEVHGYDLAARSSRIPQ